MGFIAMLSSLSVFVKNEVIYFISLLRASRHCTNFSIIRQLFKTGEIMANTSPVVTSGSNKKTRRFEPTGLFIASTDRSFIPL